MGEGSRWQAVAWAAAAVLAVVALTRLLGDGGHDEAAGGAPVAVTRHGPGAEGGSARRLYVHVAGAVRRPGLYRLPDGSRVAAAIERAGGPKRRAALGGVNLAAPVQDGQQVVVPGPGTAPATAPSAGASGDAPGAAGKAPISLGSATAEQLDQLEGIGPTLSKRIIEYRTEHGGFRSVSDLRQVDGIGEKRFAALKDAVSP